MSNSFASIVNSFVDEKLLNLNTAFIGKIISFDKTTKTATVQPLTMTKAYGKAAKKRAVLTNIPVLRNAQYKLKWETVRIPVGEGGVIELYLPQEVFIKGGDLVVCVVCDRDITEARKGKTALPSAGHHEMHNAIVIGCL